MTLTPTERVFESSYNFEKLLMAIRHLNIHLFDDHSDLAIELSGKFNLDDNEAYHILCYIIKQRQTIDNLYKEINKKDIILTENNLPIQ